MSREMSVRFVLSGNRSWAVVEVWKVFVFLLDEGMNHR